MQDQFASERYQAALRTYLQANTQRIERIENRLETLIENQQAALEELAARRPGFFASAAAKTNWSDELGSSQERLQTFRNRLTRVEELNEQSAELSEDKLRGRGPELAAVWDSMRREGRKQREIDRSAARRFDLGRDGERTLEL